MRIVHVLSSLDPKWGGPPAVASRLAAAEAGLGEQVTLATYAVADRAKEVDTLLSGVPGMDQVRLEYLPPPGRLELATARCARRFFDSLLPGADFLHGHGTWDPVIRVATVVARRHQVPYALTPHGMLDPWALSQGRIKKRLAMLVGYRRMLDQAAFLHVLNSEEARLVKLLGLRCPLETIPNGVFLEEIEPLPPKGRFLASHAELKQRPFIFFLSRLHYKKGLDYLAEAFSEVAASFPEVQLVVAGPDGGERPRFQQRIGQLHLADRVHLVGPLYGAGKYAALVDATCFCLPSRQEGFSMAITEALACGTPVVISEACHFPEVAAVGAGKVVPLEKQAIAEALKLIIGDAALRAQMAEAGRQLVRSRFTWPSIARRMVQAYQRWHGRPDADRWSVEDEKLRYGRHASLMG